jgi:hypothetical protein
MAKKATPALSSSSSSTGSSVETSSGGGDSARLLERVGRLHLAVCALEQSHELSFRLLLGANLAVGDDGIERAVPERDVLRRARAADLAGHDRDVNGAAGVRGRLHDDALALGGPAHRVARIVAAHERGDDHDGDDDHDVDAGRDRERLLTQPLADLAPHDQRRRLAPAHSATASRKRSVKVGRSSAK